ncbi:hypothetical protein HDR62_02225 [bacterium]|nr:hypothetical protein [bacterium]
MENVKLNNIEKEEVSLHEKKVTVTEPRVCGCVCTGPEAQLDTIGNNRAKTISLEGNKPIS